METIRSFLNISEAGFAVSLLTSAGIHAVLADEHAFTLGPASLSSGIRLQVPEEEVERALSILDGQEEFAPLPDDFVPPEEEGEEGGTKP